MLDQELFIDMLQSIHEVLHYDKNQTDGDEVRIMNELTGYYIYLLAGLDKDIYDSIKHYLSINENFSRDDAAALFACCAEPESELLS